jgi:hypothetical protein
MSLRIPRGLTDFVGMLSATILVIILLRSLGTPRPVALPIALVLVGVIARFVERRVNPQASAGTLWLGLGLLVWAGPIASTRR